MSVLIVHQVTNLDAFEGYDLNGDGFISKEELRKMFKSYFILSMELVRKVVKVMEEGMLANFNDEESKPVSAAFGAPSTLTDAIERPTKTEDDMSSFSSVMEGESSSMVEVEMPKDESFSDERILSRRFSADLSSPVTFDMRPSMPFMVDQDRVPIIEFVSQDAIEEMVEQVFAVAGLDAISRGSLNFEEFRIIVENDVNILAW